MFVDAILSLLFSVNRSFTSSNSQTRRMFAVLLTVVSLKHVQVSVMEKY